MQQAKITKQYALILSVNTPRKQERILIMESGIKKDLIKIRDKENEKIAVVGKYVEVKCEVDEYIYKGDETIAALTKVNYNVK